MPGLVSITDSSEDSVVEASEEDVREALDLEDEPKTYTFIAATLANSNTSLNTETELFNSGASWHMSPYRHNFINFVPIRKKVLTAADGGTFDAIGKGDMDITLLNNQSTTKILLKDILYALKMGVTLVSISKIDAAGFASLFENGALRILTSTKEVVERPDGVKVVDSKWVFQMKKDAKGKVIKWKVQLVGGDSPKFMVWIILKPSHQ
jgi:hypothetical protein